MARERYILHYLILFLGLSTMGILFVFFKYNTPAQLVVASSGCIFYMLWGIIHHAVEGRLNRLIALEYVLIGSVIFLLLFTSLGI